MRNELLKISLRQSAVYIPSGIVNNELKTLSETTMVLIANVSKLGFTFSEPLLRLLNNSPVNFKMEVFETLKSILGTDKNWAPLVKGWNIPTNETHKDHIITLFANIFKSKNGTVLPCSHLIPMNTFPLDRYNGCPFCGTPFEFGKIEKLGQGSKLKVLEVWTEVEMTAFFTSLLASKTALDATQIASLKVLIKQFSLPQVPIVMKETLMVVVDELIEQDKAEKASVFFSTPTDILRYLWYKKTTLLQLIEPKTILNRIENNNKHIFLPAENSANAKLITKNDLKLKYSRKECLMVATWLNNLELSAETACEMMHPKRAMWVRFIRALRLPEYAKRKGFENLATLLDVFYNQNYQVWQGSVNYYRLKSDAENTFMLLKQRPGLFARSLFSNMLWFGEKDTIKAFKEIIDKVPTRLVFTLNMYAQNYFDPNVKRSVKPLGGVNKRIPANPILKLYDEDHLKKMKKMIEDLCIFAIKKRFASIENTNRSIYIDPQLFNLPVAIGDRSDTVQDLPIALMGTKFPIEGDEVRLFMQWGKDLPAQHLDMDLSCHIAYASHSEICSFSNLVATGCKHSGDIRSIPNKIGTAEYININLNELRKANAKYVAFTCNAYSNGGISPNLVVGWMDSEYPMKISEKTGVAYDPSCVQHQVRITQNTTKGLVFGVLNVDRREIVWLEMTFNGQIVKGLDFNGVEAMLSKLNSKLNVGQLLTIKAYAQGLEIMPNEDADEVYDMKWAMNPALVTQLLID
ncbi:hypothetical protein [Flavobacterium sp. U410]